ncbi:MEDS domain-containing protein [Actinocrispum sp. NPDC049592]|uniref:MEDS domain-containing protein n=1 Tax=Actinocrispum sp. NPDC049592 TaxID=3154835 RepID=UPI00341C1C97
MRRSGVVRHARGLGLHDHVCWAYDDREEFRRHASEFVRDGLAERQLVWYVARGEPDMLATDLRDVAGLDEALRTGAARLVSLDAAHPVGEVVAPVAQIEAYAAATEQAIAAGYTGLRVVADCTSLVQTPRQVEAFARYEYMVDRLMATQPFSAMCAYQHSLVGNAVLTQVACLHPASNGPTPDFRLFASAQAAVMLHGELDWFSADAFAEALRQADPQPAAGQLVVDASGLRFLDHNCLLTLAEHAARHNATLVLRTAWPGAARMVRLLDLPHIRVEEAAA